ncbi:Multicopper oxidase with three cupredoxin domains (includes cell division protein FtsP and spore coat protein CotA) [bacterium A37T11]|nr:Multicopper oxidase with three cupredoxin domains (includes cell division protein FtsP and spore coat protein CotA) [bacterium A37T11]
MIKAILLYIISLGLCAATIAQPQASSPISKRYDLYLTDTLVNYTGKTRKAMAVNGSIPGPVLSFTQGDTAEIYVHNQMNVETSIHWHGVFLPNSVDGVPYLTQQPIKPGSTYLYKFPVIQNGTYWYHSHTMLQEQSGLYGALIFNKANEPAIPTIPVVLSDWTDLKPSTVERYLHNANDWFAIKKGSTQSYAEAISHGEFKTKLVNEWKRMAAMDVSDVYYEKLLTNGREVREYPGYKAGDKVRLRIVNGGSSTYFWLTWAGSKISVVANDGNAVAPVEVDRLIIAPSETYDVVLTIPGNGSYEFLSTGEDRTRSTSLWLGSGKKHSAKPLGKLHYFEGMKMMNGMMKMNGSMNPMGMEMSNQQMDMNTVMYPEGPGMGTDSNAYQTLNYGMLRSPEKSTLRKGREKVLKFELTGNMNRYVWTLDNKTVSETDVIPIKKGINVKIILYNNSMMRHPMHLHGHDFRVLNGHGAYAPLKNVLDIMPMETDIIEFAATESGDWFFHCHILYHMMAGMGRIFHYEGSAPNPQLPNPMQAMHKLGMDDRRFYPSATVGLESNGSDGELQVANTRWQVSTEWRLGLKAVHGFESETYLGRYLDRMQWFMPFIGFDYHHNTRVNVPGKNMFGQRSNQNNRQAAVVGVQYTLPLLFLSEARLDSKGKVRIQLKREDIPLSQRLRLNLMGNTDKEYMAGLRYIVTRVFSLSTHYDSDMGWGGGLTLTY